MRVLEVGGGSGLIASTLAKHWDVQVVTLEPWTDGSGILKTAQELGVGNAVLPMRLKAQSLPFPESAFDAVISIGSFEMIGEERPAALREMIRVARPGAFIGIAEPMCRPSIPVEVARLDQEHKLGFAAVFRTPEWNSQLFAEHGLKVTEAYHFEQAYTWWLEYIEGRKLSEGEVDLVRLDQGRWLSLGLVAGQKQHQ